MRTKKNKTFLQYQRLNNTTASATTTSTASTNNITAHTNKNTTDTTTMFSVVEHYDLHDKLPYMDIQKIARVYTVKEGIV